MAAPPLPASRRKSPDSAGAATADPDPAPASAPYSDSTPRSLPAPGRRGRARRSPSAGAPLGPLLPLPDALREQASISAGYPRPETAFSVASLPPGRCGALRYPLSPAAGASAARPGGRAAATSCPASPSRFFVCLGVYRPLACAPRASFAAFIRGSRTRRGPAGPPQAGPAPAAHLGGANSRGRPAIGFSLNGIKRLSVTFSVISTFRESAILRGKWERWHRRVGVFVYPGYSRGGGTGPPASARPRRRGLGLPLFHREFLKSLCWHIPSGFQPCLGFWLTGSGEVSS